MTDQPTPIEEKMVEFATKTAQTIQNQAGQIQALSHVLLIALVAMSEQQDAFRSDFLARIKQVSDHLPERPMDQFTRDYFEELVRFLEDPYHYTQTTGHDGRPDWFRGTIAGGRQPCDQARGEDPEGDEKL